MNQDLLNQAIQQQRQAANPFASAWVSASAGTGKTKVLVDRLLVLLLHGTSPEHVLCLTFTKAAAFEMQERLFDALQDWVLQDEPTLYKTLASLLSSPPTPSQILRARQLYTLALETPGGLKISTIHGFCQALLTRFPLEAGITPNPVLLDEQKGEGLLDQAKRQVLARILTQGLQELTHSVVTYFKDASLQEALQEILETRQYFYKILEKYPTLQAYTTALCEKLELETLENIWDPELSSLYLQKAYQKDQLLRRAAELDNPILSAWLVCDPSKRITLFDSYCSLYLTKKGEFLKKPKVDFPLEAEQIYRLNKALQGLELAQKSACLFHLAGTILKEYQFLKHQQNFIDYDDLVEKTIHLLTQPDISPWIIHKLDGGIQHLLVDEAQDTNPEQWRVILALTEDFLSPDQTHRTFFVVGDVKQSIYSFQGACPHDFVQLREQYREKCQAIGQSWNDIDLTVSFRSTPEVLKTVDKIVNHPPHQMALQFQYQEIRHFPFRENQQGGVYLLPAVLEQQEIKDLTPWSVPDRSRRIETSLDRVCHQVSNKVQSLLEGRRVLSSTGQPLQPKDILILVKQRGDLAPQLIRHLKKKAIPVAGMDQFRLNTHLAVKDLIALGQFLLLPQDDLTLACVLKGPFFEFTEEELLHLAAKRPQSLWQELGHREAESLKYQDTFNFLKSLFREVDYLTPYELYHLILFKLEGLKKIRSRFYLEADDAVREFLNHAFKSCLNNSTTLQQFLGEIQNTQHEVKREKGGGSLQNQVRVMTVHGAKGLQSPVVFIVEKFKKRSKRNHLLWEINEAREGEFVLIQPSKDTDTSYTSHLKREIEDLNNQEDKRLLYVALTRAQDYLYLTGYGDHEIPQDSWYQCLKTHAQVTQIPDEVSLNQTRPHDIQEDPIKTKNWLLTPVKPRKFTLINLEEKPQIQTVALERGVLIHRLFELLFDLPACAREKAAQFYLQSHHIPHIDIPLTSILEVLSSKVLSPFREGKALCEMEIIGKEGKVIRLDRVVVTEEVIKILDFKTSEKIPKRVSETPKEILKQLAYYATTMKAIYPNHRVECYLLWTAAPTLQYVPEILLKEKSSLFSES